MKNHGAFIIILKASRSVMYVTAESRVVQGINHSNHSKILIGMIIREYENNMINAPDARGLHILNFK